ncbi:hypothetical protein RBU60_10830 [Mesonia sp. MT50]|uniref:Uncharacterized protein n=1 Tax=Mesonia profundi TaxID=3070998 RepID=A0ABU1A306_9FLAO|nr:DUF6624 domain-containing protein [Mesonia profundi]MDQ7918072.1 hypothetical protein [Mesonia profundi]
MKKTILLLALAIAISACKNQQKETNENTTEKRVEKEPSPEEMAMYNGLKSEAWNFYDEKEYLKSARKYNEAFKVLGEKSNSTDRYNAACSWALANKVDSSFVQLLNVANEGNYINYDHITTDSDLNNLHDDQRWDEVLTQVKANKEKAEANLDKPLVATLDTIFKDDQGLRRQISEVEAEYGRDSKEMKAHWATITEKDSINLIKIQEILDERGWLGTDVIGRRGNSTLFLVIQHADLEVQEKYLPMMREAVEKGNAQASSLALLEDRVALRKGEKQIYGSQIGRDQETGEFYVSALIDPENVDERRAKVGLGSIADYVSNWDMTWDVEKHKERMANMENEDKMK